MFVSEVQVDQVVLVLVYQGQIVQVQFNQLVIYLVDMCLIGIVIYVCQFVGVVKIDQVWCDDVVVGICQEWDYFFVEIILVWLFMQVQDWFVICWIFIEIVDLKWSVISCFDFVIVGCEVIVFEVGELCVWGMNDVYYWFFRRNCERCQML